MEGIIRKDRNTGSTIPRNILGHNLELVLNGDFGFINERLYNSKFKGPEDPATGLAKGWCAYPINDLKGMKLRLLPGMGIGGVGGQVIENYSGKMGFGIMQSNVKIRTGEELEVCIWARSQDAPVVLQVGLKPLSANCGVYSTGTVTIDSAYWKQYSVFLNVNKDDDNAVFFCTLEGNGYVCIDQIHLKEKITGVINPRILKAIRELNPPVLRFPGGCITTVYHWKNGTGAIHTRTVGYDPVFKNHINYDFGIDEYLELCLEVGIMPHITVNISTGTPEEAYEWALYCRNWYNYRKIEPPEMYWQIGNEQYGSWEIGHMTAQMYVEVLKEFVPRVKDGYPKAIIVGLGVENGDGFVMGESHPWRSKVLEEVASLIDIYSIHWYHTIGFGENKKKQIASIDTAINNVRNMLEGILTDLDSLGMQHVKAGLTEWNTWYHAAHHDNKRFYEPYGVQHALYAASMIHMLARLSPRIGVANFYNLVNVMGVIRCEGVEVEKSILFDIFKLYEEALPGEITELEFDFHGHIEENGAVDSLCIEKSGKTYLFLINKSLDVKRTIELRGFKDMRMVEYLRGFTLEGDFQLETVGAMQRNQLTLHPLSLVCVAQV